MSMKILHIARWCSARVYKQVLAQQWAGWDVTLMAGRTPHVELHKLVEKQLGWCNDRGMDYAISAFDVVVIHTTIGTNADAFMVAGRFHALDRRLVWDCHDYCDAGDYDEYFHAVTCPSAGMASHFGDKGVVVYSKVPERLWPTFDDSRSVVDAVVFQGTMGNEADWSDYSDLEKRLEQPVFFFPSGDDVSGHDGCRIMKRLPYCKLLEELQYYSAGYAGSANSRTTIHDCVTNKFWEYKAAGLSVITWRSDEMTELNKKAHDVAMEAELPAMLKAYEGGKG